MLRFRICKLTALRADRLGNSMKKIALHILIAISAKALLGTNWFVISIRALSTAAYLVEFSVIDNEVFVVEHVDSPKYIFLPHDTVNNTVVFPEHSAPETETDLLQRSQRIHQLHVI